MQPEVLLLSESAGTQKGEALQHPVLLLDHDLTLQRHSERQ